MNPFAGKSRDQIHQAIRSKTKGEIADLVYNALAIEPHYSPGTIARMREVSKDTVLAAVKRGDFGKIHAPTLNSFRIPKSSLEAWDEATAIAASA